MTETIPLEPHLSDGDLVRLLDGEAEADETARLEAHAAACAHCARRLAVLRHRTARLGSMLRRTDFAVPAAPGPVVPAPEPAEPGVIPLRPRAPAAPPSPAGRPWLRVAAAVLVALGVGVMASPARAWIAEWISSTLSTDAKEGDQKGEAPAPAEAPPAPPAAVARVEFSPSGGEFTLEVAHPQGAGALRLEHAVGGGATAEVVGGTGSADLLVLPAGLRILNAPGSAAEYRVTVPEGVRRVHLRVGAGRRTTVEMSSVGPDGQSIPLGGG